MDTEKRGRISVTMSPEIRWDHKLRLFVDDEQVAVLEGPDATTEVEAAPGRRKVRTLSMHGASRSNLLDLEVLPGRTSPLGVTVSEAGLTSMVNVWSGLLTDHYVIWRLDNDPGKPTD